MENIKNLQVSVTYEVGISDIDAPKHIKEQLIKLCYDCEAVTMDNSDHDELRQWLNQNVLEKDAAYWEMDIQEIE